MSTILMPLGVTTLVCFFLPGFCVEYVGNLMSGMGCSRSLVHTWQLPPLQQCGLWDAGRKEVRIRLGEQGFRDLSPQHCCF